MARGPRRRQDEICDVTLPQLRGQIPKNLDLIFWSPPHFRVEHQHYALTLPLSLRLCRSANRGSSTVGSGVMKSYDLPGEPRGPQGIAMSQDHNHLNHATWECKYHVVFTPRHLMFDIQSPSPFVDCFGPEQYFHVDGR